MSAWQIAEAVLAALLFVGLTAATVTLTGWRAAIGVWVAAVAVVAAAYAIVWVIT